MVDSRIGPLVGQGRTADVFAWEEDRVVKLFHTDFAEYAPREMLATQAVYDAGVPVPAVEGSVEVEGRRGIVFERVEGRSMLETIASRPWELVRMARLLAELHAEMHACQAAGLPSRRQMLEDRIREAAALPPPVRDAVLEVLRGLPDSDAVCHGDFHPDNIIMSARGAVIIDWMDATRGDPLADVSRTWLLFRKASLPASVGTIQRWLASATRGWLWSVYLRRYRQLRPCSKQELVAWQLPTAAARLAEGIPEERALLLAFVERSLQRRGHV